ncbi:divergent polysaccharide deacetylase family protein [Ruegeria sp.]|uniref:divergent polysaccharide deacetylase family protein n=1 Tax=Ruegeria sp. TaxID=1879320 RepID=UPI003C7EAB3E
MGGFFGGLIAGAVTVLILSVALSLTTPLTRKPQVTTIAPQVADAPVLEDTENMDGTGREADLVDLPPQAPETPDEQADTLAGLEGAEEPPAAQPQTGEIPASLEAPSVPSETTITVAPEAPAALAATPVPQRPTPEVQPETVAEAPTPPEAPAAEPEVAETVIEEQPEAEPEVAEQNVQDEAEEEQIAVVQPETEAPPEIELPELKSEPSVEDNPIAVEGEEDTATRTLPRIATLPQIGSEQVSITTPSVGRRIVPLTERDDPPAETVVEEQAPPGKPIEEYAASFENPEAKPLMSIILIDDEGAYGAEALKDFPYPLTFAVHPTDPEAAEKMARHRAAGFEVLAMADLPAAASAQDAEVSMSVWLDELPETVGILEGVDSGIQGNRKLADQVAAIAGDSGRGLITLGKGLNTVQKLAARNGIPSSVVFRDFDGARQDPNVMRRFLDQAAFRAGQEGAVVMLGRVRPETISALLLWGLEDRGNRVAMAPISAVMMNAVQ